MQTASHPSGGPAPPAAAGSRDAAANGNAVANRDTIDGDVAESDEGKREELHTELRRSNIHNAAQEAESDSHAASDMRRPSLQCCASEHSPRCQWQARDQY
jgi:hypothetical protein